MVARSKSATSQVRPGFRRLLAQALRSGKLIALLLLAGSGWFGHFVLGSPRFTVRTVLAEGNVALTGAEVAHFAGAEGESMWQVQTSEIAARVAESPYVEAVKVRLEMPDTVIVTVRERQPNVRWLHDGQTFAVTGDGLIVDEIRPDNLPDGIVASDGLTETLALTETDHVAATEEAPPPFLSEVTVVDTTPNRPLKVRDRIDADALEVARRVSLRSAELDNAITRIEWDAGLGVSLILGEGRQAVIGRSDDLDRKLAVLRHILGDGTPFTFLDLRSSIPYYR